MFAIPFSLYMYISVMGLNDFPRNKRGRFVCVCVCVCVFVCVCVCVCLLSHDYGYEDVFNITHPQSGDDRNCGDKIGVPTIIFSDLR